MITTIEGDYTTAEVYLDDDNLEDLTREQIQEMVDHEAFTEPVRIMPDDTPRIGMCHRVHDAA